jgi:hypothetical protein
MSNNHTTKRLKQDVNIRAARVGVSAQQNDEKQLQFSIQDIQLHPEREVKSVFLEFRVGGREYEECEQATSALNGGELATRTHTVTASDGTKVEREIKMRRYVHRTRVVTPRQGHFYTHRCKRAKPGRPAAFAVDVFCGEWRGRDDDLGIDAVTVSCWVTHPLATNELVGRAVLRLADIANGDERQRVTLLPPGSSSAHLYDDDGGGVRSVGDVSFRMPIAEVCTYVMRALVRRRVRTHTRTHNSHFV